MEYAMKIIISVGEQIDAHGYFMILLFSNYILNFKETWLCIHYASNIL